jgi:diacylglycerol kinase family enzyme
MIVILNRGAGRHQDETQAQIENFFRSRGIAAQMLVALDGGEIARLAADAARSDAEVIVAVGGDGTVDGIASALAGTGKILGVIPLGTFNLLARRLNIPVDLEGALQTAANGRVAEINVGEVNGRVFLADQASAFTPWPCVSVRKCIGALGVAGSSLC